MERKERLRQRREADAKACREYANALPLPKAERDQIINSCLTDSVLINPNQRAKIEVYCSTVMKDPTAVQQCVGFKLLNPQANAERLLDNKTLREVATCESGRKYAPMKKVAQEFMDWCLAQIPIPTQINLVGLPETHSNWDDGDIPRERSTRISLEDSVANTPIRFGEVVYKKIYTYEHYTVLKELLAHLQTKAMTAQSSELPYTILVRQMIQLFPKTILIYPQTNENEIILIDPTGRDLAQEGLTFLENYYCLFKPNYNTILKHFISQVGGYNKINLADYNIKVIISHSHPDHFAGLSFLTPNRFEGRVEVLIHPTTFQSIQKIPWPERQIGVLNQIFSDNFLANIMEVFKLYYGDIAKYRHLFNPRVFKIKSLVCAESSNSSYEWGPLIAEDESGKSSLQIRNPQFEWAYPKGIHGGLGLIFKYSNDKKKVIFLQDLFPLSAALSTTVESYYSFDDLMWFYNGLKQEWDFTFFGSHHYPLTSSYNRVVAQSENIELLNEDFLYEGPVEDVSELRALINTVCGLMRETLTIGGPFQDIFKYFMRKRANLSEEKERMTILYTLINILLEYVNKKNNIRIADGRDYENEALGKLSQNLYKNLLRFLQCGVLDRYCGTFTKNHFPILSREVLKFVALMDSDYEIDLFIFRLLAKFSIFFYNILQKCLRQG